MPRLETRAPGGFTARPRPRGRTARPARRALAGLALLMAGAAAPDPDVMGNWLTADRTGVIQIAPCATGLCGTIVGMTEWQPDGAPRDRNGVSQCHMTIVRMHRLPPPPRWGGTILDPNTGNTYDATLRAGADGTLKLRGYIGLPIFGRTESWTRFDGVVPGDCHLPPRKK